MGVIMKFWNYCVSLVFFALLSTAAHASKQVDCMALMMYKEARGESAAGRRAVADVMINRVRHHEFPDTICGNLKPSQYQWLRKKTPIKDWALYHAIRQEAERIYALHRLGDWRDTTNGGYFFSSNGVKPAKRAYRIKKVGGHQFYGLRM